MVRTKGKRIQISEIRKIYTLITPRKRSATQSRTIRRYLRVLRRSTTSLPCFTCTVVLLRSTQRIGVIRTLRCAALTQGYPSCSPSDFLITDALIKGTNIFKKNNPNSLHPTARVEKNSIMLFGLGKSRTKIHFLRWNGKKVKSINQRFDNRRGIAAQRREEKWEKLENNYQQPTVASSTCPRFRAKRCMMRV